MLNSIEFLMIETNPADIRLTQEYLKEYKRANYLNVVKDEEEALRFLYRQNEYAFVSLPDLILINILMLLKNGVHLLKQIKNDPALSHIPIVVLTEFEGEEDILIDTSFIDLCLTKTVNPDYLFSLIKRLESGAFGSRSVRKHIPFEGDMSYEKMERARILMKVEPYDQARAIL